MTTNPYQTHGLVSLRESSRGPKTIVTHWRKQDKQFPIQEVGKAARKCASTLPIISDSTTKRKWSADVSSQQAKSKSKLINTNKWNFHRKYWVAIATGNYTWNQWKTIHVIFSSLLLALTGIRRCHWDIFKEHWIVFNRRVFHLHWSIKIIFLKSL